MKKLVFLLLLSLASTQKIKAMSNNERLLEEAALGGNFLMVMNLLHAGTNPNVTNDQGETPLIVASEKGYTKIVKALLDRDANPNTANRRGKTPLHWAAKMGRVETAQALIAAGANIHATDNTKSTPLHWAAKMGRVETVAMLLVHGANPTNVNSNNQQIATMIARYRGTQTENEVKLHGAPGSLKQLAALKTLKKLYPEHNSDTQAIRNAVNELHIDGDSKNTLLYWLGDSIQT